jgi:phage head maturation protease
MLQTVHDLATKLGADCAPAMKPTLKSLPAGMSYDQARQEVQKAISEKYGPIEETLMSGEVISRDFYCWVAELYEDTAIYEGPDHGDLYRVSYAFTSDGILLGEPVAVRRVVTYEPVDIYAVIKSATDGASFVGYLPPVRQDGQPYDNPYAVKALGDDRIGGYAVLFGDATATDLTGDYFTKSTEFWFEEFGEKRPMLYQHAVFDPATKSDPVVGTWDTFRVDDIGVWTEGQLKKAHKYKQAIQQLVDAGVLGLSSGSAPNLVLKSRKQRANEITRWPILEVSLTPEPAEPRMTPVTAIKSYFADAGLDLPAALVDASDTPAPTAGAEAPTSAQSVDDRARRLNVELDLLELSLP